MNASQSGITFGNYALGQDILIASGDWMDALNNGTIGYNVTNGNTVFYNKIDGHTMETLTGINLANVHVTVVGVLPEVGNNSYSQGVMFQLS